MFGHFTTLCMKGLKQLKAYKKNAAKMNRNMTHATLTHENENL